MSVRKADSENELLCRAWVKISEYPISSSIWEAITAEFNAAIPSDWPERTSCALETKFAGIKLHFEKFCSFHAEVHDLQQSGTVLTRLQKRSFTIAQKRTGKCAFQVHRVFILKVKMGDLPQHHIIKAWSHNAN
ncbi:hypothetical protein Ae201684P_010424 [Aphanomyces euteiches]|uniref:Uncharacterized protein n=1 Tax=Aphanomyces euteiches TaxID=100861 RepID=A0A6G0WPQ3_9STRA|nr:hypothetical protein Ae201684_013080 [Aphanomyces euteiches]KAH9076480.1 hypothetical protein Ae201684P_010424 [Aphanomyces euteiches]